MEKEQYITSSLYTFENMREGNYLYVDKTAYLWKLINKPQSMFFFSRPRRFGKSLTLSTLKAIFQGKNYRKFQNSGKKITLIGANFDFETRRLKDYKKKILD
ncbi:MAG: AAA family ATPase [Candidatus Riflebacteria bacterium]|nr:AAA family ATPase [Candidatus Riflebacteria bacterium]